MSQNTRGRAQSLKDEGNKLFIAKNFDAAMGKYDEAIALDDRNPILFANRAACRLSLRRYMDAVADAAKATELDPNYSKAWARLGTAYDELRQFDQSEEYWKKALETLPRGNLTEAELKQKEQYEKNHAASKRSMEDMKNEAKHCVSGTTACPKNQMPGVRALEMKAQLERERKYDSSAWAIASAYEQFQKGTKQMDDFRTHGPMMAMFNVQSIENITNAVLCDRRVLQCTDSAWVEKVRRQSMYCGVRVSENFH
ncbi:hypothetical protein PM082_011339 [Marasmius tenuissimus]|nr:hypothetical protein PM082_011339 [Marasmius tenuissimus]